MEKRSAHYPLSEIKAQMATVEMMNLTLSAQNGIRVAGMAKADALEVVRGLSRADFYKSMTTTQDHRVWQDVYHGQWQGKPLYVKFQQAGEYDCSVVQGVVRWHRNGMASSARSATREP